MADSTSDASALPPTIEWYQTPLPREEKRLLHQRSDLFGFLQAGGHAGLMLLTGISAWLAGQHGEWLLFAALTFLHGTVCAFCINAVHELVHGSVFRTRRLNDLFAYFFAFFDWINHKMFWASHTEHHRYTLHPPSDREVVLPIRIAVRDFFRTGFLNPKGLYIKIRNQIRKARGRFSPGWESDLVENNEKARREIISWARWMLAGHGAVLVIAILLRDWTLPLLVSCTAGYGSWIFFLVNNTQHIGLVDNVPDFRLCCRTIRLNPLCQFLYWHMNYHTEHHMYAAVPCYRLPRLHRLIAHDLPAPCNGIMATWRQIDRIQKRQDEDPDYQHAQPLPETAHPPQLGPLTRQSVGSEATGAAAG